MPQEATYSATDIVAALGISRPAFDSWVLRGYLWLPKGPGTGRTRRLTYVEVVRVALLAELIRQRVPAGQASELLRSVWSDIEAAVDDVDTIMLIDGNEARVGDGEELLSDWRGGRLAWEREQGTELLDPDDPDFVAAFRREVREGYYPRSCVILDISNVALWVRAKLDV